MGFLEERDLSSVPTIPEFYKGKTILITGGSGFMGQILIEKLLYSCSEVNKIILLIRPKKGVPIEKRLEQLHSSSAFERLAKEKPGLFASKVIAVAGDVGEIGFNLSKDDREYIKENVHIIFHTAASVRFNDDLPTATKMNIRSARELISLAKDVKNLLAYVHVSTCYCNTNYGKWIDEKLYTPLADWRDTIEICENLDKNLIDNFTHKYIGDLPNTYVFTKHLAEHLVNEQRGKLPVIIIRPSVVISSLEEPVTGWINNFNGPAGLCVGFATGVLRDVVGHETIKLDYVPVDYCIRHFLAAAWIRGTKPLESTDEVEIYICSSKGQLFSSLHEVRTIGSPLVQENPLRSCIWPPSISITYSSALHYFKFIVYQLIPAILIDMLLWVVGKKTLFVKIQRKIRQVDIALGYYMRNCWEFENKNFLTLNKRIKEQDRKSFDYDMSKVDKSDYLRDIIIGGNKFLLNEDPADLPKARTRFFWLQVFAYTLKTVVFCLIAWNVLHSSYVQNYYQSIIMYAKENL